MGVKIRLISRDTLGVVDISRSDILEFRVGPSTKSQTVQLIWFTAASSGTTFLRVADHSEAGKHFGVSERLGMTLPQMKLPHAAGFVQVGKSSFHQFAACLLQALAAVAFDAPTVVGRAPRDARSDSRPSK